MSIAEAGADTLLGTNIAGRYEILSRLGQGGMGVVYRARQISMDRLVVLKMIHPHLSGGAAAERFQREMKATSLIRHPNTVVVHDYGQTEGGQLFLVMEYLEGQSLRAVLRDGRMDPTRAVHIAGQIARALAAAHREGIVHRDLKPDNVMLLNRDDDPDFVKVLDFGIARFVNADDQAAQLTGGGLVGTPAYMSPEQIQGRGVDARSDLYSLGIVLYEMVTGAPPFQGETLSSVILQHLQQAPVAPSRVAAVPAQLEGLILQLLAKDAAGRPGSAAEVVTALSGTLDTVAQRPGRPQPGGDSGPAEADGTAGTFGASGTSGSPGTSGASGASGAAAAGGQKLVLLGAGLVGLVMVVGGGLGWRARAAAAERAALRGQLHAVLKEAGDPPTPEACQAGQTPELQALQRAARELLSRSALSQEVKDRAGAALAALAGVSGAEAAALRSRALLAQGQTEEAVAAAAAAAEQCPALALAQLGLGNAQLRAGRLGEAQAAYQKAVLLAPDYGAPRLNLALLAMRRGDARAAQGDLDELLRRQPGYPGAWLLRAQARLMLGQLDGAQQDLRAALQQTPADGQAWLLLGRALGQSGAAPEAQAAFCKALELGEKAAAAFCQRR